MEVWPSWSNMLSCSITLTLFCAYCTTHYPATKEMFQSSDIASQAHLCPLVVSAWSKNEVHRSLNPLVQPHLVLGTLLIPCPPSPAERWDAAWHSTVPCPPPLQGTAMQQALSELADHTAAAVQRNATPHHKWSEEQMVSYTI